MSKELANRVVAILDIKARNGCSEKEKTWIGFQNGNGTEVGKDIERLIKLAKKQLKR